MCAQALDAVHGVVVSDPKARYGYYGWGTVCRLEDGTLLAATSGMRCHHICPYGRTVICKSTDDGATWSAPRVIRDSPFDDRDASVVALGGGRVLAGWFTSDTRNYVAGCSERPGWLEDVEPGLRWMTDENAPRFLGSWMRISEDGGDSWGEAYRVPFLPPPHGPARLADGSLVCLGKSFDGDMAQLNTGEAPVRAWASADGRTWEARGTVPLLPGTYEGNYHEPHLVELPGGRLLAHVRLQSRGETDVTAAGYVQFSLVQSVSDDGGRTWSDPEPLGFHGAPPHLLRHSSGALVCSFGRRIEPFGERVVISRDEGATWTEYVLRDDGPTSDLGYPATVELGDGSLLTVYYQQPGTAEDKCALLWSKWTLPA
ncbi:MAG: sialidase family protein [Planctomycetota bacterium]